MRVRLSISRRQFIVGSSSVGAAALGLFAARCAPRFQRSTAFTSEERRLVEAVADQIVPPDRDPGGNAAGVADFLDIQLQGPYSRFAATYREGLARLDDTSRRLRHASFADLPFDEQTAVLTHLEKGQVPPGIWPPDEASGFFRLICDHCMQGYYGSPRHGGNRGAASWKMLKLDYPQLTGRVNTDRSPLTVDR